MSDCPECGIFPKGSKKRLICEGKSGLSPRKVNALRERWGISSRLPESSSEPQDTESVKVVIHGVSVDDKSEPVRYGAGTELLRINREAGIPHCPACEELAIKMNNMGPKWCTENIEWIINEILPRAKSWIADNKPWIHKLLPGIVEDAGIRIKLRSDITKAIDIATGVINGRIARVSKGQTPRIQSGTGCRSCGGSRRRRREVPSNNRDSPENFSNLQLSTAFGPPGEPLKKIHKVSRIPFETQGPVRNLLYHIYPAGDRWKWNLDQLLSRLDLFNGRKIIAIVTDHNSAKADDVRKYIGSNAHEYLVYNNSPRHGEMVTFLNLLAQLETTDTNQITFRAHAKGVTQKTKKAKHIIPWTEMLYRTNLDNISEVEEQLSSLAMTGACRKFDQFSKAKRLPTYSGTFYWFRNCYVYSRDWRRVTSRRWGCEEWPGRLFMPDETGCLFLDNTNSMYSESYWSNTVEPSYEKWKRERGITV